MEKVKTADMTVFSGRCLKASLFKDLRGVAFTMAEILLSLTIIGVVAAITLPSLTGNINERTWNTQRKALFSRMSQAVALMPQIRGFGDLNVAADRYNATIQNVSSDNATDTFLTNGLAKVLKLNNVCDSSNLNDCGLPAQMIKYDGKEKISINNSEFGDLFFFNSDYAKCGCGMKFTVYTKAAAFETANGESVLLHYNPTCRDIARFHGDSVNSYYQAMLSVMCANFIYDLNGKKGPNTLGKDMGFMTLFYPSKPMLVAPGVTNKTYKSTSNVTWRDATSYCRRIDEDYRLPNMEELAAMLVNEKIAFSGEGYSSGMWSSTKVDANNVYVGYTGYRSNMLESSVNSRYSAVCVKSR